MTEKILATGHQYGDPEWKKDENSENLTATFTCSVCSDKKEVPAQDNNDGVFSVSFNDKEYTYDSNAGISTADVEYVAKIGETEYETVQSAVNAIEQSTEKSGTIILLESISENIKIPAGVNITLDLNGKTITHDTTVTTPTPYAIDNAGTLAIVNNSGDPAKIVSSAASTSCVRNDVGGTLTLNGITVESCFVSVKNENDATLSVVGCTISTTYTDANTGALMNWGTANVSNTAINGGDKAPAVYATSGADGGASSVTTLTNCSLSGRYAVYARKHYSSDKTTETVNIIGGQISSTTATSINATNKNGAIANISGNVSANANALSSVLEFAAADTNVTLTNDKTKGSVTVPEGVTLTIPQNVTYTVGKTDRLVAKGTLVTNGTFNANAYNIDTQTYYATVDRAIRLTSGGNTIQVCTDVTEDITVDKKHQVTLDLNGKQLTGNITAETGTLTITDTSTVPGKVDGTLSTVENGKLIVTGGTYTTDVKDYVVAGNTTIQNQDGTYSIIADSTAAIAEFNGKGYMTLQAAIDAAAAAGSGEVTLLNSTSENIVIPADANITLNLEDGVTLTNDPTSTTAHTITNKGTLTVTGSGTVDGSTTSGQGALYNAPGATATLNGGTFTGSMWYVIKNLGTMTVNGASVKQNDIKSSAIANGYFGNKGNDCGQTATGSEQVKLTFVSGSITGGVNTIKNDDYGYLTIEGGSFSTTASDGAVIMNWNEATINGGTFSGSGTAAVISNGYQASSTNSDQGVLTITGGTFTSSDSGNLFGTGSKESGGVTTITGGTFTGAWPDNVTALPYTVAVSGGTFSDKVPESYCAKDFHPNQNSDGTYSVHVHNYGEPVFAWTDANTCTVTKTCGTCDDTLTETCTVTKETIAATATEAEKTVYTATATINGKTVTDTKTINGLAILKGKDQSYALYSGDTITILCSGALSDFVSVSVDGKAVASSNYTVKSGSTVLTFSNAYLNTLSVGDHTVTMNYKAGVYTANSVSTTLTVTAGWEKLAIEVKANRTSVRPGKTITYTLTVTNNTGTDLTDIVVSNTVDKNLTFSSSSGSGTYTAKDGLWTIPELKAGKTAKITVKYTVKSGVKDGTSLVYTSAITGAEASNGETLPDNVSPSGSVTVKVSNKASIIPATGDTSNIGLWIGVLAVVLVALVAVGVATILKTRKKK